MTKQITLTMSDELYSNLRERYDNLDNLTTRNFSRFLTELIIEGMKNNE